MPDFNPPPNWPEPPPGWRPPRGWQPGPELPEPPRGWALWVDSQGHEVPGPSGYYGGSSPTYLWIAVGVVGLVALLCCVGWAIQSVPYY
ncbi:hypothetical protein GCM10027055_22950 [Janibacter alkaliphilus]|uniref:Uncharacterized protein n=1 Tax=Janibacter alkaliphilus TaxID=1069963 RepID=A0A852X678_9MICO|nr:hypothetical protein [Janibacter alkaliphilus]NYG38399.1 hypothetical protein [Janibacter alkaliphilus]